MLQRSRYFLHVVHSNVSRQDAHLTSAPALLQKHSFWDAHPLLKTCYFPYGTCWCMLVQKEKEVGIYACAFAEHIKQLIISCHLINIFVLFFCLFAYLIPKQRFLFAISSSLRAPRRLSPVTTLNLQGNKKGQV